MIDPKKRSFLARHYRCEREMLRMTLALLDGRAGAFGVLRRDSGPVAETLANVIRNAVMESFALHARAVWFFFRDKQGTKASEYVTASRRQT